MRVAGLLAALVLAAGCGAGLGIVGSAPRPAFACGTLGFTADELAAAPRAHELGDDGRAALHGHAVEDVDPRAGWLVLRETAAALELIRELDETPNGDPGDVESHEFVRVQTVSGVTGIPDGGWMLDAQGLCTPRLDLGGLANADLALADEPGPDDVRVELEVTERACASGRSADDRVEVVEQELTDDQLRLVIGVRAASGVQECPGNPPTPVTIELDEPLGDRVVVDASTLPPRPLHASSRG